MLTTSLLNRIKWQTGKDLVCGIGKFCRKFRHLSDSFGSFTFLRINNDKHMTEINILSLPIHSEHLSCFTLFRSSLHWAPGFCWIRTNLLNGTVSDGDEFESKLELFADKLCCLVWLFCMYSENICLYRAFYLITGSPSSVLILIQLLGIHATHLRHCWLGRCKDEFISPAREAVALKAQPNVMLHISYLWTLLCYRFTLKFQTLVLSIFCCHFEYL